MRIVQNALREIGIPVFAGAWKPTPENPTAPDQYVVYTTMVTEEEHWDDEFRQYRVYVYLNLWSKGDPTEMVRRIRTDMRLAGFGFYEETDSYNDETDYNLVAATWVIYTEDTT